MTGLNPIRLIFREKERDRRKEEERDRKQEIESEADSKERNRTEPRCSSLLAERLRVAMLHREITVQQP